MKVKELLAALNKCDPMDDVVIPVTFTHPVDGPRPVVNIHSVSRGLDWINGRIMLIPTMEVAAFTSTQFEYYYSEFLKAEDQRAEARRQGVTDPKEMNKFIVNPLFRN